MRLVNAASDTVYRLAVGGRPMTVSHLDGFPIEPVEVDTVLLAMGERADVIVDVPSGVWPVQAVAEGKDGSALAWLRTADATRATPAVRSRLAEHEGRMLDLTAVRPAAAVAFPQAKPNRAVDLALTGSMREYQWGINGKTFDDHDPIQVSANERLRLRFRNETMMVHPMHLHGHTFALAPTGVRKDTVLVRPMETVEIDVIADNPGQWMLHCHNTYHLETGMATTLVYTR